MTNLSLIQGRVWVFGDNITTDHIISGKYKFSYINDIKKMLPYLFEEVYPNFFESVRKGDIIVAGRNFGIGSSREQAPRLIKLVGISAIVAKNFSRIFYRNAINIGLPVIEAKLIPDVTENNDLLLIDFVNGIIINKTKNVTEKTIPFPRAIITILSKGGVIEILKSREKGLFEND